MAHPAFFAYTYPEPPGYREAAIRPDAASYHLDLREFILPYAEVRLKRPDPLRHRKGARR